MPGKLTLNAGATLEFDSSQYAGTSSENYSLDLNEVDLEILGSQARRCTVRSNAGGDNGYIQCTGQNVDTTPEVTVQYCDFVRLGTTSIDALQAYGRDEEFLLIHSTFTDCAAISRTNAPYQDTITRIENNVWQGTISTYCVNGITSSEPLGTGTRVISENVFDKKCVLNQMRGFSIRGNYFGGNQPDIAYNLAYVEFECNIVLCEYSETGMYAPGGALDCIFVDTSGDSTLGFIKASAGEATDITIQGCLFMSDYDGDVTDGQCVRDLECQSGSTIYVKNCIALPTASGEGVGCVLYADGSANTTLSFVHNTVWSATCQVGNIYAGHAGMLAEFLSNITHYT